MKLVKVVWEDITDHHTWLDYNSDWECIEIHSVGWIIKKTKNKLVITSMKNEEFGTTGVTQVIPRGCIKSIQELRGETSSGG